MKTLDSFILFETREEFKKWLFETKFNRKITRVQNHHTLKPDCKDYNGSNHFSLLGSMKRYHVNTAKMIDIAQNLTTFPDGSIAVCRSFELDPAGIKGANKGSLCIEHVGNFDTETMTEEHMKTIVFLNAVLCMRFNLSPTTDTILYHHWFDLDSGIRTNGTGNTKTCPGVKFFGGNSVEDAQTKFIPLVIKEIQKQNGVSEMEDIKKVVDEVKKELKLPPLWNGIEKGILKSKELGFIKNTHEPDELLNFGNFAAVMNNFFEIVDTRLKALEEKLK